MSGWFYSWDKVCAGGKGDAMIHALLTKASHWAWVGAPLFAAADVTIPGIAPWGSLTATGLLGWYLWYDVCRKQPRQEANQAKQIARHAEQLKDQSERYEVILDKQTAEHRAEIDRLCDTLRGGSD